MSILVIADHDGGSFKATATELLGKASELAKGLQHPVPALFHLLFKVCHAPQARTHTARPCRLTWCAPDLVRADPGHHNLHVRRLVL